MQHQFEEPARPRTQLFVGLLGSTLHTVRSGPDGYWLQAFPGGTLGKFSLKGLTGCEGSFPLFAAPLR